MHVYFVAMADESIVYVHAESAAAAYRLAVHYYGAESVNGAYGWNDPSGLPPAAAAGFVNLEPMAMAA